MGFLSINKKKKKTLKIYLHNNLDNRDMGLDIFSKHQTVCWRRSNACLAFRSKTVQKTPVTNSFKTHDYAYVATSETNSFLRVQRRVVVAVEIFIANAESETRRTPRGFR